MNPINYDEIVEQIIALANQGNTMQIIENALELPPFFIAVTPQLQQAYIKGRTKYIIDIRQKVFDEVMSSEGGSSTMLATVYKDLGVDEQTTKVSPIEILLYDLVDKDREKPSTSTSLNLK